METPLAPTERFRRQHRELLGVAAEIGGLLAPEKLVAADRAAEVRRLFAQLAGRLHVHARMENDALYPRLMTHPEREVRVLATGLHAELGVVYDSLGAFLAAWPSAASITASPTEFVRQAMRLFRILGKRMHREESELYPLVDRAEAH